MLSPCSNTVKERERKYEVDEIDGLINGRLTSWKEAALETSSHVSKWGNI